MDICTYAVQAVVTPLSNAQCVELKPQIRQDVCDPQIIVRKSHPQLKTIDNKGVVF